MNTDILNYYSKHKSDKQTYILDELKQQYPDLSLDLLSELYKSCISIHQTKQQNNGNFFESKIESILTQADIPYKSQVSINTDAIIIGFGIIKDCYHVLDFVVGSDIVIGKHISEFIVLSCKVTCRERWTQDNWSLTHKPKKFILLTLTSDYPLSTRFDESETRKIITCEPKVNDKRIYKLTFDNLIAEL
jgi:hypothetical protein